MRYNWLPSPFDARDHLYEVKGTTLPDIVMPMPAVGAPYDQGQEGSCTGNAYARIFRAMHPDFDPSRNFIYDGERLIEGTPLTKDSGAYGRDGAKLLKNTGVCAEHLWPYKHATMVKKPPQACYDDAANHKISGYKALHTRYDMLDCLASGGLIAFGFVVFESFESDAVAKTGVVPMPTHGEKNLGGHEVFMCGYDLKREVFICGNSWGDWGMRLTLADGSNHGGFFEMPFAYVMNRKLCDDFYTLIK